MQEGSNLELTAITELWQLKLQQIYQYVSKMSMGIVIMSIRTCHTKCRFEIVARCSWVRPPQDSSVRVVRPINLGNVWTPESQLMSGRHNLVMFVG